MFRSVFRSYYLWFASIDSQSVLIVPGEKAIQTKRRRKGRHTTFPASPPRFQVNPIQRPISMLRSSTYPTTKLLMTEISIPRFTPTSPLPFGKNNISFCATPNVYDNCISLCRRQTIYDIVAGMGHEFLLGVYTRASILLCLARIHFGGG